MSLFKYKERPPVPEELANQKKKGLLRVMELLDRDGGKFWKSGILALLSLLPLFLAVLTALVNGSLMLLLLCAPMGMLAGPQLAAAADTIMRSMRDEIGWWWWDTYKQVWKRNAKSSLLPGALGGLVTGLQIYCLYVLTTFENPAGEFWMLLGGMVLTMAVTQFFLPMLVCMDIPFVSLLRNCFVLFLCHPVKALLAALVQIVYYGIILIWFPLTLVILGMTSVWLPMLLSYSMLYGAMDQHMGLTEAYEQMQKVQWGD